MIIYKYSHLVECVKGLSCVAIVYYLGIENWTKKTTRR